MEDLTWALKLFTAVISLLLVLLKVFTHKSEK